MATSHGSTADPGARHDKDELVPAGYLRIVAIWSLVPGYMLAGGLLGYFLDRWFDTWPFIFSACLAIALALAVRDMLRLRREMFE
jgi:F0F1-type ATP synthase assembly protein I